METEQIIIATIQQRAKSIGFPVEDITPKLDLIKSGLYDSMSFIDLIVSLEEVCGVVIDLENISPKEISTVQSLVNTIQKLKHD